MHPWINEELKIKIREVFQPYYSYPLTEKEVITIGENLTSLIHLVTSS